MEVFSMATYLFINSAINRKKVLLGRSLAVCCSRQRKSPDLLYCCSMCAAAAAIWGAVGCARRSSKILKHGRLGKVRGTCIALNCRVGSRPTTFTGPYCFG